MISEDDGIFEVNHKQPTVSSPTSTALLCVEKKCANCVRWTRPRKNSACYMDEILNPNFIPKNDFIKNEDGSYHCSDFKSKDT